MHDPAIHSSSFDLAPSGSARVIRAILGLAFFGAVIVAGYIVFKLVTEDRAGKACDRFDTLAAKETPARREELVRYIERSVSSQVVQYGLVKSEHVEVHGCHDAVATLEKAMDNKHFVQLTECMEKASTAWGAAHCF